MIDPHRNEEEIILAKNAMFAFDNNYLYSIHDISGKRKVRLFSNHDLQKLNMKTTKMSSL